MAHFHRRLCSKVTSHCLTHGINGIEPIIAPQIKLLPQIGQNKTKLAGYHEASRTDRARSHLRIMPLGGSVTYGSESTDGNGYRRILQELLMSDGHMVEMVGSRKAGSMENNDNEGWRGFRIDQITNKAKASVPRFLPNLFTVNAGSNDCVQHFEIETTGKRLSDMLEYLWMASSGSTIVLSTLLPNLDGKIDSRVLRANEQFREMAKAKAAQGRKIVIVDMRGPDGPQISDLADGTHPNDVGYAKMATIWRRGIHEAVHKDFIQEPLQLGPRDIA
ncbi:unnamed protein product [Penicillium egyptiacum]|uniref:SGNH hydrolase-type esterase domain-containing protein n=1 Tax=Penicillium egyptiacum TaxID=1303716 RepID=A0A9W4KJU9_9EURO|nr:unnamed protein product [Penicillium egyptiacum]